MYIFKFKHVSFSSYNLENRGYLVHPKSFESPFEEIMKMIIKKGFQQAVVLTYTQNLITEEQMMPLSCWPIREARSHFHPDIIRTPGQRPHSP